MFTSLGRLLSFANTTGTSIWDAASDPEQVLDLGPPAVKALRRFMATMHVLRERAEGSTTVAAVVHDVLRETGYLEALEAERTIEAQGRIENLEELVNVAAEYDGSEAESHSLDEFLQQISLRSDAVETTIYAPGVYLIPRNGHVIVGSTEEHVGFELGTPAAAELHERAAALIPALRDAEMVDAWCGFRPGSKDGLPYIGKVDERTYIATGHYRNGILLAPITGKLLAELIVTGKTSKLLEPCDPLR